MKFEERLSKARGIFDAGLARVASTPEPKGQKFKIGSFVKIAADLGQSMSHFEKNRFAKVQYTYSHAYGGADSKSYSLLVKYEDGEWSSVAWYSEHQLSLVKDKKLIQQFEAELS